MEARHSGRPTSVLIAVLGLFLASCGDGSAAAVGPTTAPPTSAPTATASTATSTTAIASTTAEPPTDHDRCLRRAVFDDPGESPYVLPYPPGDGYSIIQSYCHDDGSHENQLAYDFAMPLGSTIVASRSGVVIEVKEDVPDDEHSRHLNYLLIRHKDNTVGFYAHLQHEGVLVEIDDEVEQGQEIGLSGATGRTGGPVLHFGVYFSYPPVEGRDIPVVFSNTSGSLDSRGGLREGTYYEAEAAN